MEIDLGFLQLATQEMLDDVERIRDVELADLLSTVFGTWSFFISIVFVLWTGDMMGIISGILPSQFIALASGVNVYREHVGLDGWETMNLVSVFAALWMLMASTIISGHSIMQFSNTFAAMWIGLSATYASFLRQNDPHRETIVQIKIPLA